MEVMLERVQFKFASIIGELCSEPLVLSQFAVWVDMRLAEYKLKGSISLDCSGETPDPIWMKGITFALAEKLKEAQSKAAKALAGFKVAKPQPRTGIGQGDTHILSYQDGPSLSEITHDLSDNVLVKAEPVDEQDIYPLGLFVNNDKQENSTVRKEARKRPSSTASNMTSPTYTSGSEPQAKSSRLSLEECEITDVTGEADNTSLLSIIGMNTSQQDNHSFTGQNTDNVTLEGDDSIQEYLSSPRQMGDNSSIISSQQGSSNHDLNSTSMSSQPTPNQKGRVVYRSQTLSTITKTKGHVNMFQNWLKKQTPAEYRKMDEIPPAELDSYLVVFFGTIKQLSGEDYVPSSFKSLRLSLERYLKDTNYPCSITGSEEFAASKKVYRERMHLLTMRKQHSS